jgi:hypothetical protein
MTVVRSLSSRRSGRATRHRIEADDLNRMWAVRHVAHQDAEVSYHTHGPFGGFARIHDPDGTTHDVPGGQERVDWIKVLDDAT